VDERKGNTLPPGPAMRWPCVICGRSIDAMRSGANIEIDKTLYALHARCGRRWEQGQRRRIPLYLEVTPQDGPAFLAVFYRNPLAKLRDPARDPRDEEGGGPVMNKDEQGFTREQLQVLVAQTDLVLGALASLGRDVNALFLALVHKGLMAADDWQAAKQEISATLEVEKAVNPDVEQQFRELDQLRRQIRRLIDDIDEEGREG
jgi:hypothetical protein